jgi:hypothetical protein
LIPGEAASDYQQLLTGYHPFSSHHRRMPLLITMRNTANPRKRLGGQSSQTEPKS